MTCAPGMHGATRSTSSIAVQTSSMGAVTVKVFSNSMGTSRSWGGRRRYRPARLRPRGPTAPRRVLTMQITVSVNGEEHTHDVEPRLLLVHFLRDTVGLTGTHWGCDTS